MKKTILITGGTGYIGSWTVKYALEAGHTVRLAVRDKKQDYKYDFLQEVANSTKGSLEIWEGDLLKKGSYDKMAEGCDTILHMASPFTLRFKDAEKDLLEPAIKGTENVLEAANKSGTVKLVVLTSSVASVHGDNIDMKNQGLTEFSEDNWNTTSSATHQPYSYSKVSAEKKAWEIHDKQNSWVLKVINPSFVMGPVLSKSSNSESIQFMKDMMSGKFAMGAPDLYFGFVDVRDVAKAHLLAIDNPNFKGRCILAERTANVMNLAEVVKAKFPKKYKLPSSSAPKWLFQLIGPLFGVTRKFVKNNVGIPIKLNTQKSTKYLGLNYQAFEDTVVDMVKSLEK